MLDEASSQAFPSTANCFTLTDDDILRFLENDIETDGAMVRKFTDVSDVSG